MHQVNDVVVQGGKIVLSNVPFADGQHVRVTVAERSDAPQERLSIAEVRRQLEGSVEHLAEPSEPMIPQGNWQMIV